MMMDLDWKTGMVSSDIPVKSPKLSSKLQIDIPPPARASTSSPISCAPPAACSAYENYLRLSDLRKLWSLRDFPKWENEPILRPALQALEITFRLVSVVLSDPRQYINQRQWIRRLESLATSQIGLVASICDERDSASDFGAPIDSGDSYGGVLDREQSLTEVWNSYGADKTTVVSRVSEASLLPRLSTWWKSEDIAQKIMYSIECEMRACRYTLGVGEPNLCGKPNLQYDEICRPNELHNLKKNPYHDQIDNHENQTLYTTHQILESWIYVAEQLVNRVIHRIDNEDFEKASDDCYLLERIWKLLTEIEEVHMIMDPEDFLKLKNQLHIKSVSQKDAFCFRSRGLVQLTKMSKELKHNVPWILGVEADPKGGPRVQEAAMKLYSEKKNFKKIHLLQALQALEASVKRFYYAYKQVLAILMGSAEANANRAVGSHESCDSVTQIFLEPTYFPSLDAAKTFLGEFRNGKKR